MTQTLAPLQALLLQRLGWALAHFLWQGTLVAALLASVNVLLARRRAPLRYAASCAALLLMLAWAGTTFARYRPQGAFSRQPQSETGLGIRGSARRRSKVRCAAPPSCRSSFAMAPRGS